jgi:hypothetical protein
VSSKSSPDEAAEDSVELRAGSSNMVTGMWSVDWLWSRRAVSPLSVVGEAGAVTCESGAAAAGGTMSGGRRRQRRWAGRGRRRRRRRRWAGGGRRRWLMGGGGGRPQAEATYEVVNRRGVCGGAATGQSVVGV